MIIPTVPILLLGSIASVVAQNYDYRSNTLTDPIRRALGLWGRLLDRMAQPGPPTDDQLHLRGAQPFDDLPQDRFFGKTNPSDREGLFRGPNFGALEKLFRKDSNGSGTDARSIIDERRLLELLPRIREPDTATTTTTTTTTSTTTTTTATTASETTTGITEKPVTNADITTIESSTTIASTTHSLKPPSKSAKARYRSKTARRKSQRRRKAKAEQKATELAEAANFTATVTESTVTSIETTTSEISTAEATKNVKTTESISQTEISNIREKTEVSVKKNNEIKTTSGQNVENEAKNDTIVSSNKMELIRKETEQLISEIEKVLIHDNWIVDVNATKSSSEQTEITESIEVSGSNSTNADVEHKAREEGNIKTDDTKNKNKAEKKWKSKEINDQGDDQVDGSGEEPEDASTTVAHTVTTTKNTTPTTKSIVSTTSTTKVNKKAFSPKPNEAKDVKKGKKDYIIDEYEYEGEEEEEEDGDEGGLDLDYKEYRRLKFKDHGNASGTETKEKQEKPRSKKPHGIPEAEPEEEDKSGNDAMAQHDAASIAASSAAASASGKSVAAVSSYFANAIDPAAVVVPVRYANSIIDGIGPLILPLLGYSGREAASVVRAAASPTYRGQQKSQQPQQQELQNHQMQQLQQQLQQLQQQQLTNQDQSRHNIAAGVKTASQIRDYSSQATVAPYAQERRYAMPPVYDDDDSATPAPTYHVNAVSSSDTRMLAQDLDTAHLHQMQGAASQWAPSGSLRSRVVNAETDPKAADGIHGLQPRFMPNPAAISQIGHPTPTVFASDAIRQALSNILLQPRITTPTTQGMADNALSQIYSEPSRQNAASVAAEPGNELGLQNVANNFYEDSGVMVGGSGNAAPPQLPSASLTAGSGGVGFGGGHRPSVSIDDTLQ